MRINHIAINCKDIELVKSFFMTYLEAYEGAEYHNPKTGLHSWMLLFTEGSTKVELMSWNDMKLHEQGLHEQGLVHISVSVNSRGKVDSLTARLVADGYQCLSGPRTTGDGYYESSIVGPEGLIFEITV